MRQAIAQRPPLGVLGDFVVQDGDNGPMLDLKKSGTRLFVDAARVIALTAGLTHTSSAERLRQGGAKLGMSAYEIGSAVEAFFLAHAPAQQLPRSIWHGQPIPVER